LRPERQIGFRPASPDDLATGAGEPQTRKQSKRMKQFIQHLAVLRATPGRFLAAAVVIATAFAFNTQAQAGLGQGAMVTPGDPDENWTFTSLSPDGQMRLDVYDTGQSVVHVLNPDGTLHAYATATQAAMRLSVLGSDGEWVPTWTGIGSFHKTSTIEQVSEDAFSDTGEAIYFHVQGQLTMADGSPWSLLAVAVEQDYEFKVLKIDLRPR